MKRGEFKLCQFTSQVEISIQDLFSKLDVLSQSRNAYKQKDIHTQTAQGKLRNNITTLKL